MTEGLPPCRDVVISVSEMQQSCQRIVQTSMETNHQNKVWVGVKVNFAVCRVLHLHTPTHGCNLIWRHRTVSQKYDMLESLRENKHIPVSAAARCCWRQPAESRCCHTQYETHPRCWFPWQTRGPAQECTRHCLSGRMIWNFPTTPGLCYQGFLKLLKCNSWKMSCFYVLLKIVSVFTTWNYLIKHLMKKYNNLDNRFSRFQRQQIQVAFFPVKKLFFSKLFGSYCYNMSLNMSSTCLQINLTKILLENPQIGLTSA